MNLAGASWCLAKLFLQQFTDQHACGFWAVCVCHNGPRSNSEHKLIIQNECGVGLVFVAEILDLCATWCAAECIFLVLGDGLRALIVFTHHLSQEKNYDFQMSRESKFEHQNHRRNTPGVFLDGPGGN